MESHGNSFGKMFSSPFAQTWIPKPAVRSSWWQFNRTRAASIVSQR